MDRSYMGSNTILHLCVCVFDRRWRTSSGSRRWTTWVLWLSSTTWRRSSSCCMKTTIRLVPRTGSLSTSSSEEASAGLLNGDAFCFMSVLLWREGPLLRGAFPCGASLQPGSERMWWRGECSSGLWFPPCFIRGVWMFALRLKVIIILKRKFNILTQTVHNRFCLFKSDERISRFAFLT